MIFSLKKKDFTKLCRIYNYDCDPKSTQNSNVEAQFIVRCVPN